MKTPNEGNFKHRQWKATLEPSQLHHEDWQAYITEQTQKLASQLIELAQTGHDIRRAEISLFAVVESAPVLEEVPA